MPNNKKIIALIPTRLNFKDFCESTTPINNLPLIIHVYRRTLLSKLIDDAIICCTTKNC